MLALVLLTAWLSHPLIASLQSLAAKERRARGKGNPLRRKVEKSPNLGTPSSLPNPQTSRSESHPPMSKKRPTGIGAICGGPHHARRLGPDECMLCRQVGHRASECPNKGKGIAFSPGKRAFGTYALGCAVFDVTCYGATVEETEQDQDENDIEDFVAFSIKSLEGFAILDGRATKTVFGFNQWRIKTRTPRLRRQMLATRSLAAKRRRQA